MKKYSLLIALALYCCLLFTVFGWILYRGGEFGNYYLEQEIYHGQPSSWLWHKHQIVWYHISRLDEFNENTFPQDRKAAEEITIRLKKAEALIK